jgi:hypothetical protein
VFLPTERFENCRISASDMNPKDLRESLLSKWLKQLESICKENLTENFQRRGMMKDIRSI